jgi:hypothetical protein
VIASASSWAARSYVNASGVPLVGERPDRQLHAVERDAFDVARG